MNGGNGGDLTPDLDRSVDRNVNPDEAHGTARRGGAE